MNTASGRSFGEYAVSIALPGLWGKRELECALWLERLKRKGKAPRPLLEHDKGAQFAVNAFETIVERLPSGSPIHVAGTSLGGHTTVRAASMEPRFKAAAEISGPYSSRILAKLGIPFLRTVQQVTCLGAKEAEAFAAGVTLEEHMKQLRVPLLVIHGDGDPIVPVDEAHAIYDHIPEGVPKDLWIVHKDFHGNYDTDPAICDRIVGWFKRFED